MVPKGGLDPPRVSPPPLPVGHKDIKTTMIYVSLGKSHIREQVERLNGVYPAVAGRQRNTLYNL